MTWFLRKALRLGPLRLNLSKRGVGASFGVKGARIGVDATGKPYVFGGRRGFYFRQRLGTLPHAPENPAASPDAAEEPSGAALSAAPIPEQPRSGRFLAAVLIILALLVGVLIGVWLAGHGTG